MLDDLQQRIALAVAELDEGDGFVLAGGGALIVLGVISRSTQDLDYFTTRPEDVQPLADALVASLRTSGMEVNVEQATPTFVRLIISLRDSQTRVDLGADARMLEPTDTEFGVALSIEELAVDKVLATSVEPKPETSSTWLRCSHTSGSPTSSASPSRRTLASTRTSSARCSIDSTDWPETNSTSTTGRTSDSKQ